MIFRVAIVDDHALVRRGLQQLLAAEPNFDVVGSADDGSHVEDLMRSAAPDVESIHIEVDAAQHESDDSRSTVSMALDEMEGAS